MKFIIHPLLIVFFVVLSLLGYLNLLIVYLITIVLHELAHSFVASKLGYKLNQIKLMPYGASLSGQSGFFSAKDEILVALAGPVFNLVLVVFVCALWWIEPVSYVYTLDFVRANLAIALINFLPIFPLDGGRILLSVLSERKSRAVAHQKVRWLGVVFSVIILTGFVITTFYIPNYTFLVFGSFLFIISIMEDNASVYTMVDFLSMKKQGLERGIVVRELAISNDSPLYKLFSKLKKDRLTNFFVVDKNYQIVGKIMETELESLIKIYPAKTLLSQILFK